MDLDAQISQRIFQQIMQIFISPAIEMRRAAGLRTPTMLRAAQVIFYPDGRKPEVRLNEEVRAIGKVKFREGISKKAGEAILEDEVEGLEDLRLSETDLPDCGHATFISFRGSWILAFDFRYNKDTARQHLDAASQFLQTAEFALERGLCSPFLDNLFSAAELTARADLLIMPDKKFREKASHRAISVKYNRFAYLGNVAPSHIDAFNRLAGLRDEARYLRRPFKVSAEEASTLVRTVSEMIASVRKLTSPEPRR